MILTEVLETLPEDRYVYLGTDGGSKWLFICRRARMQSVLGKIDDHFRREFPGKDDGAEWISLMSREVAETYLHTTEPVGTAVIIRGNETGRYWDLEEVQWAAEEGYRPGFRPERRRKG